MKKGVVDLSVLSFCMFDLRSRLATRPVVQYVRRVAGQDGQPPPRGLPWKLPERQARSCPIIYRKTSIDNLYFESLSFVVR